jgi:muramidase (phage lysozyme)
MISIDEPEQALKRVFAVTQALVTLSGCKPVVLLEDASSPSNNASCQLAQRIEARPFRRSESGHPGLTEIPRLRPAIVGGVIVAALCFVTVWYARFYLYSRESVAPLAPMMSSADSKRSSAAETRTVSRDMPVEGRALLDTIAGSESAYPGRDAYKVIYGGRVSETLTDHPRQHVEIVAGPNAGKKTSAAGRYQYLARSWDEARRALGLPDFSPESQDKAAFWEAQRTYRAKTGRDLIADIREANGDPQKLAGIGRGISSWWTSLPGGIEPNKATSSFGDRFAQNLLYYQGLMQLSARSRLPDSTAAIEPAPSVAPPRAGLGTSDETQAAAPDANYRSRRKGTAGLDAHNIKPPQATSRALVVRLNRLLPAPSHQSRDFQGLAERRSVSSESTAPLGSIASQPDNLTSSPRGRLAAFQASKAEHRTEVRTGFQVEPETRPTTVNGWVVRDVIGGKAILEGPGGIRNVALGDVLPDLGKIDSIIRWGSRWIVSTERGLISTL